MQRLRWSTGPRRSRAGCLPSSLRCKRSISSSAKCLSMASARSWSSTRFSGLGPGSVWSGGESPSSNSRRMTLNLRPSVAILNRLMTRSSPSNCSGSCSSNRPSLSRTNRLARTDWQISDVPSRADRAVIAATAHREASVAANKRLEHLGELGGGVRLAGSHSLDKTSECVLGRHRRPRAKKSLFQIFLSGRAAPARSPDRDVCRASIVGRSPRAIESPPTERGQGCSGDGPVNCGGNVSGDARANSSGNGASIVVPKQDCWFAEGVFIAKDRDHPERTWGRRMSATVRP